MTEILACQKWPTNGHLIEDVAKLDYLDKSWVTLDATYGKGTWWKRWRPYSLMTNDIAIGDAERNHDFRYLPWVDDYFDAVAYDPPYKLNGTSAHASDASYGVAGPYQSVVEKYQLIKDGATECVRVLRPGGYLLLKCQDQVVSGKVHWQTRTFSDHVESLDCGLVDRFDFLGHRAQPPGRRQVHARRNYSTLLVFRKS